MNDSIAAAITRFRHLLGIGVAALICLSLVSAAACGSEATPTPTPMPEPTAAPATATSAPEPTPAPATATPAPATATPAPATDTPEPQTGTEGDSDADGNEDRDGDGNGDSDSASSGQSSASSSDSDTGKAHSNGDSDSGGHGDSDSGSDSTVTNVNPGGEGMLFDNSRNVALFGAEPLNAVQWTVGPVITPGELVAEGVLEQGAILFNPMVDGEGAGFSVFYKGHEEAMVELLPDLEPMFVWDTFQTVAPTEMEIEGASFKIRAYSPLFMDAGPGDLELRVYGYDQSGADALLAVQDIEVE